MGRVPGDAELTARAQASVLEGARLTKKHHSWVLPHLLALVLLSQALPWVVTQILQAACDRVRSRHEFPLRTLCHEPLQTKVPARTSD